jgi:hypothetical protein
MMAKMGHQPGEGLGKHGTGRLEPVTVQQRDARSGLGVYQLRNIDELQDAPSAPLFLTEDDVHDLHPVQCGKSQAETGLGLVLGQPLAAVRLSKFCRANILKELQETRLTLLPTVLDQLAQYTSVGGAFPTALLRWCPQLLLTTPTDGSGVKSTMEYLVRQVFQEDPATTAIFGTMAAGKLPTIATQFVAPPGLTHPSQPTIHFSTDLSGFTTVAAWQASLPSTSVKLGLIYHSADVAAVAGAGQGRAEAEASTTALRNVLGLLSTLVEQGNAVVELSDCFTRLSTSLVYLLYRSFDEIQLIKPMTANPLAPSRYVICMGRRPVSVLQPVLDVLQVALATPEPTALLSLVPIADMLQVGFLSHLVNANERVALRELATIRRLHQALQQLGALDKAEQQRLERLTREELESKLQGLDPSDIEGLSVGHEVDEVALMAFVHACSPKT